MDVYKTKLLIFHIAPCQPSTNTSDYLFMIVNLSDYMIGDVSIETAIAAEDQPLNNLNILSHNYLDLCRLSLGFIHAKRKRTRTQDGQKKWFQDTCTLTEAKAEISVPP